MIVVIDNYDSFTYNLVQYLGELGATLRVFRNDAVTLDDIRALDPTHIVISPGPGDPTEAGISNTVIQDMHRATPILGVCLGHQCIGHVFGGNVTRAPRLMHGKTSRVFHRGSGLYQGLPNPFEAGRYHSLIVQEPLPEPLIVTAFTEQGEVMGLQHKTAPMYGVQFHPESVLTPHGKQLLQNFLNIASSSLEVARSRYQVARGLALTIPAT
ncbi:MAG TPA: aminodeoxychorismate/anthranilate synthase component II [Anaerolineae bacterium]|nr:aminodeoxychorismate/anthranilate synthase component II [Anaerolineae bacterium]